MWYVFFMTGSLDYLPFFTLFLAQLCKETNECDYWSWIDPERWNNPTMQVKNHCFLKNDNSGQQDMIGVVSGYKTCPENLSKLP